MGRTKDEKLVYFAKLKELIEAFRELKFRTQRKAREVSEERISRRVLGVGLELSGGCVAGREMVECDQS